MQSIIIGDLATWLASIVAVISAVIAARSARASEKLQKALSYQAAVRADILEKEHELKRREWADQYFISTRTWAEEVCNAISHAIHLAENPELGMDEKRPVLIKLSALVDTGRWYFPNHWVDDYGMHKEPAYRGIRQPVLDCVVEAYEILKLSGQIPSASKEIVLCQREFSSHIQKLLDPRKREQEIKKVIHEFEIAERLRVAPGDVATRSSAKARKQI